MERVSIRRLFWTLGLSFWPSMAAWALQTKQAGGLITP